MMVTVTLVIYRAELLLQQSMFIRILCW